MKQFIISLFISLPILLTGSAHAAALPCGVNFDAMTINSNNSQVTLKATAASQWDLICLNDTIGKCEATFNGLDQFIVIKSNDDEAGTDPELVIDPATQYPITCQPVV